MKHFLSIGLLAVSLAASIQGLAEDTSVAAARTAAQAWVGLLDAGNYSQSWSTAAKHIRDTIPESKWVSHISEFRGRLGAVQSRSLVAADFAHSQVPGAPGERVVVRYATHFEHQANASEFVTMVKDADGQWRMDGYNIK